MEQSGIVKSINGDIAKIAFVKKTGCGGGCSGCKSGCPVDTVILDVKNTENAKIGDSVVVSLEDNALSKMNFWAYIFPTVFTIIILLGSLFVLNSLNVSKYELYSGILSMLAMVIAFKIGGIISKRKNTADFNLKMLKIMTNYRS